MATHSADAGAPDPFDGQPGRKRARATNRGGAELSEIIVDNVISKRANQTRFGRVAASGCLIVESEFAAMLRDVMYALPQSAASSRVGRRPEPGNHNLESLGSTGYRGVWIPGSGALARRPRNDRCGLRQRCHLCRANVIYARERHVWGKGHLSAPSSTSLHDFVTRAAVVPDARALQRAMSSMESMRGAHEKRAWTQ